MVLRAVLLSAGLCLAAQPARAQTRVYLAGDVFADIVRPSRTLTTLSSDFNSASLGAPPTETVGGGARIGAFLSPEWSVEMSAGLGRTASDSRKALIPVPAGISFPALPDIDTRSNRRLAVVSVLIGYHPATHRRIRPGFRGGVGLSHSRTAYSVVTSASIFPAVPGRPTSVPVVTFKTTEFTSIINGLTATLAADAAIELSQHAAVVPELRVHAGGLGAIVLRPGVALRWIF